MTDNIISKYESKLQDAGAENVSEYIEKLGSNKNNTDVFEDLLFEGLAASMLLSNGFEVKMRDSPDLDIKINGSQFYAEVKHFRLKLQDNLDQEKMEATNAKLVTIGETKATEGDEAWEQIAKVAEKKKGQYVENSPNILVIGSSSPYSIDDAIIPTAINIISEKICGGSCRDLDKLNGILLMSQEYNLRRKRNVFFFQNHNQRIPLDQIILESLYSIRNWEKQI